MKSKENNHFYPKGFFQRWHLIGFDDEHGVLVENGNVLTIKQLQDLQECIDDSINYIKNNNVDVDKLNRQLEYRRQQYYEELSQNYECTYRRPASAQLTHGKRMKVYKKYGGKCHYCGKEVPENNFHVDHMTPLSRGGSNKFENLCLSCPHCNMSKGTMTDKEYLNKIHKGA